MSKYSHPGGGVAIDAESLAGMRFPYQEDRSLVEDIDLLAATPGEDINWLEDIQLLVEDGVPAVFDRYTNAFIKIYFEIPAGREDELARKVLIKHLQSGNSYGIQLKREHCKFPQPFLGSWVPGSETVGAELEAAGARGLGAARPLTSQDRCCRFVARPPQMGADSDSPGASATARRTLPDAARRSAQAPSSSAASRAAPCSPR